MEEELAAMAPRAQMALPIRKEGYNARIWKACRSMDQNSVKVMHLRRDQFIVLYRDAMEFQWGAYCMEMDLWNILPLNLKKGPNWIL